MRLRYEDMGRGLAALMIATGILAGCTDDLGSPDSGGPRIGFSVDIPSVWADGNVMTEGNTTRCASVDSLRGDGGPQLYLHTMTAEPARASADSRGTMVSEMYEDFSLSGICYTDGALDDTPADFLFNAKFNKAGVPAEGGESLFWPKGGRIKFFAVAPFSTPDLYYTTDALSPGAPKIRYRLPKKVEDQVDILTAVADATEQAHTNVELEFGHALAAIQVKTDKDMLAATVTGVTISGVYGTGVLDLGSGVWAPDGDVTGFSVAPDKELNAAGNSYVTGSEETIVDGNLTFFMIPQTIPASATMSVTFTDKLTGVSRTVSGKIGDGSRKWDNGKIYTYKVSPSSVNVNPIVSIAFKSDEFVKYPAEAGKDNGRLPYTGSIYGVEMTLGAQVTQAGQAPAEGVMKSAEGLKVSYQIGNGGEIECTSPEDWFTYDEASQKLVGKIVLPGQDVYNQKLKITTSESKGTKEAPLDLSTEHGESANCYMICAPGYYKFPVVYGNALRGGSTNSSAYTINRATPAGVDTELGMTDYPDYNNSPIGRPWIGGEKKEAILMWEDSPDLVQDVKLLKGSGNHDYISFKVDEDALAHGNALIAVRDASGIIMWSWHIWVTSPENYSGWYGSDHTVTAVDEEGVSHPYTFVPTNLGYCPAHDDASARTVKVTIQYAFPMPDGVTSGALTDVAVLTLKQDNIEKSRAGENPYYQWGRKDPIAPGYHNESTTNEITKYKSGQASNTENTSNPGNQRRKPLFHVHPEYTRSRTPYLDVNNPNDFANNQGVSVGYTIRYPNELIMGTDLNSRKAEYNYKDYRKHWHNMNSTSGGLAAGNYAVTSTKTMYNKTDKKEIEKEITNMYNLWNSTAYSRGTGGHTKLEHPDKSPTGREKVNFQKVTKTVYDPCPPGFNVPPGGAFLGLADPGTSGSHSPKDKNEENCPKKSSSDYHYKFPSTIGKSLEFFITGVRDLNIQSTTSASGYTIIVPDNVYDFKNHSICSWQDISYITSATIVDDYWDAITGDGMVLIFIIDRRKIATDGQLNLNVAPSNNSYGLPVRPILSEK